jgi:FkbM family methyltransferase
MDLAGAVVADVGANVGRLSQFFWDAGDAHTRVVSIEPLPQNLEQLRRRAKTAGSERWRVEACAASSADGTLWIEPSHDDAHGWNSAVRADAGGDGRIEVACRRLSTLVPDATIVKVDIEGHEYVVLDEALEAMTGVVTWTVELHMVPQRPLGGVLEQFDRAGFDVFAAGQRPGDASGTWKNVAIPTTLQWDRIPVAQRRADGSVFKMLHVIAHRRPAASAAGP